MSPTSRRPGPESTLDDVRAQLVEAGMGLLRKRGVEVGLAEISLSDTIAAAGVTRSTAYRSLADDEMAPQARLHRELLNHMLLRYSRGDTLAKLQEDVAAELERQRANLESDDVALHTLAMRSVIRVGANASYQGVIDSPERAMLTAVYGAFQSAGRSDWRSGPLGEGEQGLTEMFSELYSGLARLFDYHIKPEFSLDQFTAAGASLIEGMAMRHGVNEFVITTERPTGVNGALEEWSLFAIAFEAMFVGMWQPENPDDPFADLLHY